MAALFIPFAFVAAAVAPAPRDLNYGPAASWVLPPPKADATTADGDAPVRFIFSDVQVRIGPDGEETHAAYRAKILKPEALALGNVAISWSPSAGEARVHRLRIVRDGQEIDVLKDSRFDVLQREGGLERSILDGALTAALQVPGLQVGDELEFAATIRRRDPTLGERSFGANQLPTEGAQGIFRYRLSWPKDKALTTRWSPDLAEPTQSATSSERALAFELRNPDGVVPTEGAPARFNIRRLIEYSDFGAWPDLSRRMWPLYRVAATLAPESPLREEARRIAAAHSDPAARAEAALRLVQERVRYVYVGLDGGNYRPASADETWQRRFGDCKGKTAVLLALLDALGIAAEPVLVSASGGDGTDQRLASPAAFDHILVRARVGDGAYWLDGTRAGDRALDALPPPAFRWALPLAEDGRPLEPVKPIAPVRPLFTQVLDINATRGTDQPAKVSVRHIFRQDEAFAIRSTLAAQSATDAERAVRSYWRESMQWVDPVRVTWSYDDRRATLVFRLEGEGKPDWETEDGDRSLKIHGAGFVPPDMLKRPPEQDQTAPWATDFPRFRCWATMIRLPPPAAGRRWTFHADPMNLRLGGIAYWRRAALDGSVMRTVMSRQAYLPEISAAQAAEQTRRIPSFNNNMSSVYEAEKPEEGTIGRPAPFTDDADWETEASACRAPAAP